MAQTEAVTTIQVFHGGGLAPATVAAKYNPASVAGRLGAVALARLFEAAAGGMRPCKIVARTDSFVAVQASLTMAVTQANIAVGEYLDIVVPNNRAYRLTAVTSGADVTLGQFVSQTSNAVTATNIAAAVNGMLGLKEFVSATTNSGNLILTVREYGSNGNSFVAIDGTVNGLSPAGGAFAGGLDASASRTASVVITHANVTNNDTVNIGGVAITAKTSASASGEWTIGASATADATAMAAAINAHPSLLGLVSASAASGTVTLTYLGDARTALLVYLTTSDATAFALTQFTAGVSTTNVQTPQTYQLGAP